MTTKPTLSPVLQTNPIWNSKYITDNQRIEMASVVADENLRLRLANIWHTVGIRSGNESSKEQIHTVSLNNQTARNLAIEYLGITEHLENWWVDIEVSRRGVSLTANRHSGYDGTEGSEKSWKAYKGLFFADLVTENHLMTYNNFACDGTFDDILAMEGVTDWSRIENPSEKEVTEFIIMIERLFALPVSS